MGGSLHMVKITNVPSPEDARPLVHTLHDRTYMRFQVLVCPVGGSFDVLVQSAYETTDEDFTGMVLAVLADSVLRHAGALAKVTDALEAVSGDLAEAHAEERDAAHYGESACSYCDDLETAREAIAWAHRVQTL